MLGEIIVVVCLVKKFSYFTCLRKPKDLQTTDQFFVGNTSII